MLRYSVASVGFAELVLLSFSLVSMGSGQGLQFVIPLHSRIFLAYAAWFSVMPLLFCRTSIPK
jgi:hypothetical protein